MWCAGMALVPTVRRGGYDERLRVVERSLQGRVHIPDDSLVWLGFYSASIDNGGTT
jgi:hypothetical protein